MKHLITTNNEKNRKAIDKRSVGVSLKFKILNFTLNTFFKDWTILKDIVVTKDHIIVKNLGPVFGSNVILSANTISICTPKQFTKEVKKVINK